MERKQRNGRAETRLALDGLTVRKLLPQRYPMTVLDRVEAFCCEERTLIGIKQVSQNEPFLQGHFPGHPVFPGVLLIEALAQASGCLMNLDHLLAHGVPPEALPHRILEVTVPKSVLVESKIKHVAPVYPGDQVKLESRILLKRDDLCTFKVCARVNGAEVSKGQLTLARTPLEGP